MFVFLLSDREGKETLNSVYGHEGNVAILYQTHLSCWAWVACVRILIEKLGYVLRHLSIYLQGLKVNIKLLSLRTKITEITYLRDMQLFLHHRHKPWFDRALYFPPFAHGCCSRPLVHWLVGDDWVVLHCPKSWIVVFPNLSKIDLMSTL